MKRFLLFTFPTLLLLAACGVQEPPVERETPFGPVTATGTVTQTGASLVRRGTHMLLMDGRPRFFLESKTVNLSEYQDALVALQGDLFPNTAPSFLPVIAVTAVQVLGEAQKTEMQTYAIAPLAMKLEAPKEWQSSLVKNRFSLSIATEKVPFIMIEDATLPPIADGMSLRIDGQNGVRITKEGSDIHEIYVSRNGNRTTLFTFDPQGEASLRARDAFYTMLRSVRFTDTKVSSSSVSSAAHTGSGQPCGGTAGVICPPGEYCVITELGTGIGVCRSL